MTPVLNEQELTDYLAEEYPQTHDAYPGLNIKHISSGLVDIEMETDERHIRAGGTVSGPTIFALADLGGYACVLSHVGREALSVTTSLNLNFMRKAPPGKLLARCRILKLGKRLMVFDAEITSAGQEGLIAHATGTYAIPPRAVE